VVQKVVAANITVALNIGNSEQWVPISWPCSPSDDRDVFSYSNDLNNKWHGDTCC